MSAPALRLGVGWDLHPLTASRPFTLLGLRVAETGGPLGHSDGDVLAHCVADALLSAAHLGDIGSMFPAGEPKYENLPGDRLLREVVAAVQQKGYRVEQVRVVLAVNGPSLAPHLKKLEARLAEILEVAEEGVSITVKRGERVGAIGRGEAAMGYAVALLRRETASIQVLVDAGVRPNPGKGAFGIVAFVEGKEIRHSGTFPETLTSNACEYRALLEALQLAEQHGWQQVEFLTDSELLYRQLRGDYRVRHPALRNLYERVCSVLARHPGWHLRKVPRKRIQAAHQLVRQALG